MKFKQISLGVYRSPYYPIGICEKGYFEIWHEDKSTWRVWLSDTDGFSSVDNFRTLRLAKEYVSKEITSALDQLKAEEIRTQSL